MSETFLKTFSVLKPLAPAQVIDTGTVDATGNFQLIDNDKTFTSMILEPGMIVVNTTSGKEAYARIVEIQNANTLLLDRHIMTAIGDTYEILWPARDAIKPGTGQELILFKVWAKKGVTSSQEYGLALFKQGLGEYLTETLAESGAGDGFDITQRLLPTDTEWYVIENWTKNTADYVVEGLDKTLGQLFQQGATLDSSS